MSEFVSALVGGFFTLIGAFGAIFITNYLNIRKDKREKYISKIEEIADIAGKLEIWNEAEREMYYSPGFDRYDCSLDYSGENEQPCPLRELEILVSWWQQSIEQEFQEIKKAVEFYRRLHTPEGWAEFNDEQWGSSDGYNGKLDEELTKHFKILQENCVSIIEKAKSIATKEAYSIRKIDK